MLTCLFTRQTKEFISILVEPLDKKFQDPKVTIWIECEFHYNIVSINSKLKGINQGRQDKVILTIPGVVFLM